MAQTKRGIERVYASDAKSGSSIELFGLPILANVEKSLECPICCCIPEKMAVQCSLGHIACLECVDSCEVSARGQHRTVKCATCRVDMKKPYAPSPLANALLLGLSDECKHCKVRAPWAELHAEHNNNCLPFKRRKVQEVSADGTLTNFEGLHGREAIVSIHTKNDAGESIIEFFEGVYCSLEPRKSAQFLSLLHTLEHFWTTSHACKKHTTTHQNCHMHARCRCRAANQR
jgi:hypothetical protein